VGSPLLVVGAVALLATVLLGLFHLLKLISSSHSRDLESASDVQAASDELLRLHYDNSPDMLLSVELETQRVVRCNATTLARLGYSREELLGMSRKELYAPACRERAAEAFQEFLATGRVEDVDLQVMCKDGSVIDISLSAVQYSDRAGTTQYSYATWRDITQRKRDEAQARKREKQLMTFYLMGEQMLLNTNLSVLMHNVAYSLYATLSVRCVLVCELCFEQRRLIVQAALGVPRNCVRSTHPVLISPTSLPAKALAAGGLIHMSAQASPQWLQGMHYLGDVSPDSGVATVLRDSDGDFGLIMAFHEAGSDFSQTDLDYVESLANLLSVAADRIRLKAGLRTWQISGG
jgi:PAS domain S-box-containing protein